VEAIVVMALLVSLAVLSLRFGHDSRRGFLSKEEEFARRGMRWKAGPPA
jgi:hypothetical protein